ncbi:MAG: hypothetical protein KF802_09610 [Bdellovibrionaceae bacterium]|nr:hypothetical protein [Pseudobdellovibrionaceae bacterium]MBX3033626.1 hypothetical protein [Pseudobdellovibrionaceae bacterium]
MLRWKIPSVLVLSLALGCAPKKEEAENKNQEAGQSQPPPPADPDPTPLPPAPVEEKQVVLLETFFIRTLHQDVLEAAATLPVGTVITVRKDATLVHHPYRMTNGQTAVSITGFLPIHRIMQIPAGYEMELPPERLQQLLHLPGGLFVSGRVAVP